MLRNRTIHVALDVGIARRREERHHVETRLREAMSASFL